MRHAVRRASNIAEQIAEMRNGLLNSRHDLQPWHFETFGVTYVGLLMSGYLCLCQAHLKVEAIRLRQHVVNRPKHRLVVLPCRQQEEDAGDTHFALFSPGSVTLAHVARLRGQKPSQCRCCQGSPRSAANQGRTLITAHLAMTAAQQL